MLPRAGVEATGEPEENFSEGSVVGEEDYDGGDDGSEEGVDSHAGQKQGGHGKSTPDCGDAVNQKRGSHSAHEGEGGKGKEEQAGNARGNGRHRTDRTACGNTNYPGVGHGVAEKALHGSAGDAQGHADKGADYDPREADLLDYQKFGGA